MNDIPQRYDPVAMLLHWLIAAAIFTAVVSGLYASSLPISPARLRWVNWHKWLGIAILVASIFRLIWRSFRPAPALPVAVVARMARWQQGAHQGVHVALYVLFFAVPLAGWAYSSMAGFPIVWFGVLPLPDWMPVDKALAPALRAAHKVLAYGLSLLVVLHVAAVVKHQWFDRDGLMRRMLPANRRLR